VDSINLDQHLPLVGCCKHGNESLGSIKAGYVFTS
jgi:hypothetical protein